MRRAKPSGSSDELPSRSRDAKFTVTRSGRSFRLSLSLQTPYHSSNAVRHLPPQYDRWSCHLSSDRRQKIACPTYFTSTVAPASVNFFLMASASSLFTPSLIGLGAPSTRSLASFKPRLVTSRTALITLILFAPAAVRTTVNSVFSSAGAAAAAAPPPAGATATAAA